MKSIQLRDLQETDSSFQTVKTLYYGTTERGRGEEARGEGFLYSECHFIDLYKSFPAPGVEEWAFPAGDLKGSIQQDLQ